MSTETNPATERLVCGVLTALAILFTLLALAAPAAGQVGYNPLPDRPDPWAYVESLGDGWERVLCLHPNNAWQAERIARDVLPGVPLEASLSQVWAAAERSRELMDARYRGYGSCGPEGGCCEGTPTCGAEDERNKCVRALIWHCEHEWGEPGDSCVPSTREERDCSWTCEANPLFCRAGWEAKWPGMHPDNRAERCDPARPPGAKWKKLGGGCLDYFVQAEGCGTEEADPVDPVGPVDPPPHQEEECKLYEGSRCQSWCEGRGWDRETCFGKAASFPGSTTGRVCSEVCREEPPPPPPPPEKRCLRWRPADGEVQGQQRFVPGSGSTGRMEIELIVDGQWEEVPCE